MQQNERSKNSGQVTQLLEQWCAGDQASYEQLFSVLYEDLRAIAQRHMRRESAAHTLQATALVNEAYGRLGGLEVSWNDSGHFLAIASRVMRRMLVDHARGRDSAKRGGGMLKISLDDVATMVHPENPRLLDLESALVQLGQRDPRKEQIIELHFFGGLTQPQIADALNVSASTVERDLRMAKAWLKRALNEPD